MDSGYLATATFSADDEFSFLFTSCGFMCYIDTRQHANFYQTSVNLTKYRIGVNCLGVQVCNMLPYCIKIESDNLKKFKLVLKKFLYENSSHSLDEYFEFQKSEIYVYMIQISI